MSNRLQTIDLALTFTQLHQFYEESRKIARVEHWNNQAVVEVQLMSGNAVGVGVKVIVERIAETVREEAKRRKAEGRPYIEGELLHILFEVSQGLAYAKTKTIPHGKISLDKIGKGQDGRYKLIWLELALVSFLQESPPTIYHSPEFTGPTFPSDVFALGMTILCLAAMGEPFGPCDSSRLSAQLVSSIQALPYSSPFKALLTSMLVLDPTQRPSIEQVSSQARRPYVYFLNTPLSAGEVQASPVSNYANIQVDIHDGWLDVFDCETETWKDAIQVAPLIDVQFSMAFAFLPNANLFICGGIEPCSSKAWQVTLSTRQIQSQPPMTEARSEHIAVYAKNSVYVFGGRGSEKTGLFSSEKYVLERMRWVSLPNSPYFVCWTTPCLHNDHILLPGGFGTDLVQLFNLSTEQFSVLNFRLPTTGPTFAVIDNDCLVLVQKGWTSRCHLGSTQGQVVETSFEDYWFGGMPAVVCGRRAFLMLSRKELKALDLNSI